MELKVKYCGKRTAGVFTFQKTMESIVENGLLNGKNMINAKKGLKKHDLVDINLDFLKELTCTVSNLVEFVPEEKAAWKEVGLFQYGPTYFSTDSLQAIELKLVRSPEDIDVVEGSFHPSMAYQIFGEYEKIVGYRGLKVRLYYTAGNLITFMDMSYEEKAEGTGPGDLKPVDVLKLMGEKLQPGYLTSVEDFTEALAREAEFKPHGSMVHQFAMPMDGEEDEIQFEVFAVDFSLPEFRDYNQRLQTFLLWYIEAASFADSDDERWRFFVVYEKTHDAHYAVAGFLSVYEFYHHPDKVRPRISQMLVLPPFQGRGIGAQLLETACRYYREQPNAIDITVESPSEEFQRIRDYVDCKAAATLPSFAPKLLKRGFSKDMETEAHELLKMNKKQVLRVYNILRLMNCDSENHAEMEAYIRSLETQVDKPHQVMLARAKRKRLFEKLSMKLVLEAMPSLNEDYRRSLLQQATDIMLEQFRQVIARLKADEEEEEEEEEN